MDKLIEFYAWNDVTIPIANINAVGTISIKYDQSLTEEEKNICGEYIEACVDGRISNLPENIEVFTVGSTLTFRKKE